MLYIILCKSILGVMLADFLISNRFVGLLCPVCITKFLFIFGLESVQTLISIVALIPPNFENVSSWRQGLVPLRHS